MAEAVFAHKVKDAGLADIIEVDSAATSSWELGQPPHSGTMAVLKKRQIVFDHVARKITKVDLEKFDYILTMDEDNNRSVSSMGPTSAKVLRFLDFAPGLGIKEVPDPWYDGRFEYVYELIDEAAEGLLNAIKETLIKKPV
jgi:protein-tyrosine phosphatase